MPSELIIMSGHGNRKNVPGKNCYRTLFSMVDKNELYILAYKEL